MKGMTGAAEIRYSDDVGGNDIALFLDGRRKGSFSTQTTGGWDAFAYTCQRVDLGELTAAQHSLEVRMIRGGSYGSILDLLHITSARPSHESDDAAAYAFLKSLVEPATGLVRSTECAEWTTIYKNALAAMAFIHEGDLSLAEHVFGFFDAQYEPTAFQGLPKTWSVLTGRPAAPADYWEGDNAFLLIALEYYRQATGSLGPHAALAHGLVR
jgi:hypothetical protein